MATTRSKTTADGSKNGDKKKPGFFARVKRCTVLFVIFAILASAVFSVWFVGFYAPAQLFSKNKHFALRRVKINSEYWQRHETELMNVLDIRYGESLFKLDLPKIRSQLLKINPNYQPQVYIRIPDTLEIKVVESSPVARIDVKKEVKKNGRLKIAGTADALDENGNAISLARLGMKDIRLPLISGLPAGNKYDKELVMPALKLLNTVQTRYPDIEILEISVQKKNILEFVFLWRREYRFKAQFAADDTNFAERVNALQNHILEEGRKNSGSNIFNLCEPGRIYSDTGRI